MKKYYIFSILIMILSVNTVSALGVPPPIEAGELKPGKIYEFTAFIQNDNEKKNIILEMTPRSEYLKEYVEITPENFVILPDERKEIRIILNIPETIPPGEHSLTIKPSFTFESGGVSLVSTSVIVLKFFVSGKIVNELKLVDFIVNNEGFILQAENTGNIRTEALPIIEVNDKRIKGSTKYLINPGEFKEMEISYKGEVRKAVAYVDYGKETDTIIKTFSNGHTETKRKPPITEIDEQRDIVNLFTGKSSEKNNSSFTNLIIIIITIIILFVAYRKLWVRK